MDQQQICDGCNHRNACRAVYERLGKARGPSVVCNVLTAFVLPILAFIAALTVFQAIFGRFTDQQQVKTAVTFVAALAVTFVLIIALSTLTKLLNKHKLPQNHGD